MSSKFLNANTDVNLSANSDSQIPSQKAVKTYVDNKTSVLATKEELTEYLKTTDAQNTYSKVENTVSDVVAGASANQIKVTKGGSTKTITINNVANATTATKASQDINGRSIVNGYISTDFGGSVKGTDVRVQANYYGTSARPKNYFRNVNLLHTVKNNFYRADKNLYNKGTVTVTCSYDDVVSGLGVSMLNGSADGYHPSINPSTMFSDKPFVWEILSSVSFEVTDVCNLFITGHRLGSTGLFTKYKLEVTNAYNSGNPTWYTLVDYDGDAVDLGNKHFGLYSSEISTSPAYHSVYGVRLTISGSTSTVFQMSQIMLLCSRGTENVSDGVHALDVGKGGTVVGNITVPTQHGSFIGNLNGTASKATADASGNTITTTYATKNELNTGLSSKQGTLTAGTGISITDSTISNAFTSLDSYTTFSEAALNDNSSFIYKNTDGAYLRGNFINFVNSIIKPSFATKDDLSTKQNTISDLDTIRSGAALGSTALQSVPEEYITESELAAKNYATTTDLTTGLSTKQDIISDLATIREGAALGATSVQHEDLSEVAISGMYSDLTGKPGAATTDTLGLVKVDGTTITATADGVISAKGDSGAKRSIGEVYFSQSSIASDNPGALPLFTGETIASANTIYPDFYSWVLAHTELQCTSEEYESALSTYGECPKYVLGTEGIAGFCLRTDYSGDAPDGYYVSSSSLNGRIINSSWGTATVNRNPIVYFNLSKVKNKPYTSFQIYLDNNLTQKALINTGGTKPTDRYLGVRYNLDENKFYFTIATKAANTDSDEFTGTSLLSSDCCIEADKYAYNSSSLPVGSLRLPKLSNYIKAANTSEGITQGSAGLPNITGQTGVNTTGGIGAFSNTVENIKGTVAISGYNTTTTTSNFDASRSSAVYGASDTVTPAHTTLYPWVVAYTAAIPASTAQAAEFQQGLSGKADTNLGNLSTAGKDLASGLGMPSNRYIDLTLGASGSTYTAPANGYFIIRKNSTGSNQAFYFHNKTSSMSTYIGSHIANWEMDLSINAKKGDIVEIFNTLGGKTIYFRFIYAEGAK